MATVTELRERRDAEICYLLGIEGIPYMWTTNAEIAGGGPGSWIGQDDESRTVIPGLMTPRGVTVKIEPQSRMLGATNTSFKLQESRSGDLLSVIFNPDWDNVEEAANSVPRFTPYEDPAPANVFVGWGDIPTANTWVGDEAIGPNGERRYYPLLPDQVLPGDDHFMVPLDYDEGSPIGIADFPFNFEGRRVALWRLFKDVDGGNSGADAWAPWSDQHAQEGLLWWGRMKKEVKSQGGIYTISCQGPESWLKKQLNVNSTKKWTRVNSALQLEESERFIWVAMQKWETGKSLSAGTIYNGVMIQSDNGDPGFTYDEFPTLAQCASTLNFAIKETITRVGPGDATDYDPHAYDEEETENINPFTITPAGYADFEPNQRTFRIRLPYPPSDDEVALFLGHMRVIVHEKVLRRMGYDPTVQQREDFNFIAGTEKAFQAVKLNPGDPPIDWNGDDVTVPTEGYWLLTFTTKAPNGIFWNQTNAQRNNEGALRNYYRLTDQSVVLATSGSQRIALESQADDDLFVQGQLGRPVTGDAPFTVDSTRWWAIRGPYARLVERNGAQEVETITDFTTVFKASWNDISGEPAVIAPDFGKTLWIEYIDDPRKWGFDFDPLEPGLWSALSPNVNDAPGADDRNVFRVTPLASWVYGGQNDPKEQTGAVLSRLFLSTGTASWPAQATEDNPGDPTPGVNQPVDAGVYGDREIADLGLAIPYAMVDVDSLKNADTAMVDDLRRVRVVRHGAVNSQELIGGMIAPGGWSIGLRGKKYGVYRAFEDSDVVDIDAVLNESTYHNATAQVGKGYTTASPYKVYGDFSRVSIDYFGNPITGGTQKDSEFPVRDLTVRLRPGVRDYTVEAPYLGFDPKKDEQGWTGAMRQLWANQIARWNTRPRLLINGVRVPRQVGQDLYPGSIVSITNAWIPVTGGGYGITDYIGRVIEVTHGTAVGSVDCSVELTILAEPKSLKDKRYFAPLARVLDLVADSEDRYDPGTNTFFCYSDAWQTGSNLSDVLAFQEPEFSNAGGDALIWGYQYDGNTWAQNFSGNVLSVNGQANTITLTGPITGTFFERQYTILVLAPYETVGQAAWVQDIFSVMTRPDGTFGAGNDGWKLTN